MTPFPDRFGPLDYIRMVNRADDPGELALEGEWLYWLNGPRELWEVRSCEWSEDDETHVVRFSCIPSSPGEPHDEETMLGVLPGELWRVRLVTTQPNGLISLTMADGSHMVFRKAVDPLAPPLACPARSRGGSSGKTGRRRGERTVWGDRETKSWGDGESESWWSEGGKKGDFL